MPVIEININFYQMANGIEKMQTITLDEIELVYINADFADVRLLPKNNIGARKNLTVITLRVLRSCHHRFLPRIQVCAMG